MPVNKRWSLMLLAGALIASVAQAEDCLITVSQPDVNYNQMRRDDIVTTQQNWHKFAEREVTISATCPEKQVMAVLAQGSAGEKGRFLFGSRGGVGVRIDRVTVDGQAYTLGKTVDQVNLTPESGVSSPMYLRNNEAVVAVDNNMVQEGKQLTMTVTLFPVLNESMFSGIADQTTIESDITWRLLTK